MTIDMGLDDPDSMGMLTWAMTIIDESVDRLRDEIGSNAPSDDSEVYRLARALPPGQISFDRTVFTAANAARGALDQIRDILRNGIPTSVIVLHALLRSALVGAGRIAFALLPADPSARLQNARVLVAQESTSTSSSTSTPTTGPTSGMPPTTTARPCSRRSTPIANCWPRCTSKCRSCRGTETPNCWR